MRALPLILFFFSSLYSYSLCADTTLIKPWGKWNDLHYNSAVFRIEHRNNDSILPANIRRIVKEALIARCGEKFYSQVSIRDLSIVIPVHKKQNSEDLFAEGILKKGDIKYYYSFLFREAPNIEYRFNIALDVQGIILTEWSVPKLKDNEFQKFVSFCEAIAIAQNDKKADVKKINDITLMYDPRLNYFAWKTTIGFKYHHGDNHYKSYRLTTNVFTGEIIDRWDADVTKYDSPTHK